MFRMGQFNDDDKKTYIAALTAYFAFFNKNLKSHGRAYLSGDKLTIADFHVTAYLNSVAINKHSKLPADWANAVHEIMAANPDFHAYLERMSAELKDYLTSRPASDRWNYKF